MPCIQMYFCISAFRLLLEIKSFICIRRHSKLKGHRSNLLPFTAITLVVGGSLLLPGLQVSCLPSPLGFNSQDWETGKKITVKSIKFNCGWWRNMFKASPWCGVIRPLPGAEPNSRDHLTLQLNVNNSQKSSQQTLGFTEGKQMCRK